MIRAAVLGADVSKSRSPAIHNAAFEALGVDGTYVAHSVDAAGFPALVQQLRADGHRYLNVTIPHKEAAAQLAAAQGPEVRASGAANTLLLATPAAPIQAENTDGAGLIAALADLGVAVAGKTIVMVGAGGAAAGAAEALIRADATVLILARRAEAAIALNDRLTPAKPKQFDAAVWTADALRIAIAKADVLISAVPAAAWAPDDARAGLDALRPSSAVLEMAYGSVTPLAEATRPRTDRYADGLGMLVHQAARAIELALGVKPPLKPLFRAARQGP
ncbi:MAG TPA: NAD(P)-dependent oxidoreductase [Polyangia bacterium]|nr:NAD(P)-dependent oxidoreductase [Polyangia bacterium]